MKNQSPPNFPQVDQYSFTRDNDANKTDALYNELLQLPDVIFQTDLDFIITGWNDAAEKICALSEVKAKNIFELDNINFSAESIEIMKQQFRNDGIWNGNIHFNRKDGMDIYFRSSAHYIMDAEGKPSSIMIVNHNINQQIIAAQKLVETEAMYKMVIDALDQGVLLIQANGMIMAANKKASEILGVAQENLIGQIPVSGGRWKVFRANGKPFPDCELPAVVSLQTGFPQKDVEVRIEKPDGKSFSILISSQAIMREGEFNPYAVVVSFIDISDDKVNTASE
ncbi:PAS domain-containing protein [Ferruginibacter sp. SUN106]|uniref:PAS domain-containing protein n=1 Tax=Ferruginibacter sp. SUN106 TaxID=2978348 RepID=UPI003D363F5C